MLRTRHFPLLCMLLVLFSSASAQVVNLQVLDSQRRPQRAPELLSAEATEQLRVKGLALLNEVAGQLSQIRSAENRIRAQVQTAQLLWTSDDENARKLMKEATEGMREYLTSVDESDQNYYMVYQSAMQLRQEALQALAPHDPELALNFLRSTRILSNPQAGQQYSQPDQELQLEQMLAGHIALKDPQRALQIAEESLEQGFSYGLIDTLSRLRQKDPQVAAKLAGKIVAKLGGENLLKNGEAGNVALNLLRLADSPPEARHSAIASTAAPLLTEQEIRELLNRSLTAALSFNALSSHTPISSHMYSPERNNAQNILNTLQSMTHITEKYAPGRAAAIGKKAAEFNAPPEAQGQLWQKYQEAINNGTVDQALESIRRAPAEIKENLYQQVALKASGAGDIARAKQILIEHISNPIQRQQALRNIEQQAFYHAVASNKIEEALAVVENLRSPKERAMMLLQIVNQSGATQKKETILFLLEHAFGLVGTSGRIEDQEQMNALFEIARAYASREPDRAFEILELIAHQFNELSLAALTLDGFGQRFFSDGELMLQNGNTLAGISQQIQYTLGSLARVDFERAKTAADKLQRLEVRLAVYLAIAQHALQQENGEINNAANITYN